MSRHRDGARRTVRGRHRPLHPRSRARRRARLQRPRLRPKCTPRSSSSKPPTSSGRRSTWPTSTTRTSPSSRPAGCRTSHPAPTRPAHVRNGRIRLEGIALAGTTPARGGPGERPLLNWNNKPAPEWGAASDNDYEAPVHRVQLYPGYRNDEGMTEANDVSIMNGAATEDLRGVKVWPNGQRCLADTGADRARRRNGGADLQMGRRRVEPVRPAPGERPRRRRHERISTPIAKPCPWPRRSAA